MTENQTEELVYIGSPPSSAQQYYSRLELVIGSSPVQFASNRRTGRRIESHKPPRKLTCGPPLTYLVKRCLGRSEVELPDVHALLKEKFGARKLQEPEQTSQNAKPTEPAGRSEVNQADARMERAARRSIVQSKASTSEGFLTAIATAVQEEASMMKFDYLALHQDCIRLLTRPLGRSRRVL